MGNRPQGLIRNVEEEEEEEEEEETVNLKVKHLSQPIKKSVILSHNIKRMFCKNYNS
jgi:RNase P subunit RPR2